MKDAKPIGYSGTPLAKKLGITEGVHILLRNGPDEYMQWIAPVPNGVVFDRKLSEATDIVHVFNDRCATLQKELASLRTSIRRDAVLWISWPKKASKVPSDITEDTIRELALPLGFVDVKVCAVSDVWSGLKLVIRKAHR
jgi:hypothetical protein